MPAFVVLAAKFEGDEPTKFVVSGGGVTTSQRAVDHFTWANQFVGEDGAAQKWFSVKAESDQPVSLKDVDRMPTPLRKIVGK